MNYQGTNDRTMVVRQYGWYVQQYVQHRRPRRTCKSEHDTSNQYFFSSANLSLFIVNKFDVEASFGDLFSLFLAIARE
jgi:hypothetical protein